MDKLKKDILGFFEKIHYVSAIILFGSFSRNAENEKSDIDLAVLYEQNHVPSVETLISLREDLGSLLHRDVDLICLNTASPILGMQVYKDGKNLLVKDEKELACYYMRLFSDYAELKELRAPMEKDILKRKYYD